MRVIISDQMGYTLNRFGCSKQMQFANGVVVNDKEEMFMSDNGAQYVKVLNYRGVLLRPIGGEGMTNYPVGVGMKPAGQILVADNDNNFNLTVVSQHGQLINALESKVNMANVSMWHWWRRDVLYLQVKTTGNNIYTINMVLKRKEIRTNEKATTPKNHKQHKTTEIPADNKGRVMLVECKVMRVMIFDHMGNILNKFGCSKHLELANGVVVNDKEEICMSDNGAHCVKVFKYQGVFPH